MGRTEMIIDHREKSPSELAELAFLRVEVFASLSQLTLIERRVLELRYGLDPLRYGEAYTMEEIARVMKCTRNRIRGIECKALAKLQHRNRCENLACFLFETHCD